MGMTAIAMVVTFLLLEGVKRTTLFNVPTLVVWILTGVLCIGAGKVRVRYHAAESGVHGVASLRARWPASLR